MHTPSWNDMFYDPRSGLRSTMFDVKDFFHSIFSPLHSSNLFYWFGFGFSYQIGQVEHWPEVGRVTSILAFFKITRKLHELGFLARISTDASDSMGYKSGKAELLGVAESQLQN